MIVVMIILRVATKVLKYLLMWLIIFITKTRIQSDMVDQLDNIYHLVTKKLQYGEPHDTSIVQSLAI